MRFLEDIQNAVSARDIAQDNFESIERVLFQASTPTFVSGVANTIIGPPTTGTWAQYDRWTDKNGAIWECTAGGTPGTWQQVLAARMAADPVAGTYPTGYLIARTDKQNRERVCTVGGTPGTWAWAGMGLNAVADATGPGDVVTQLNSLLARIRSAGIILP